MRLSHKTDYALRVLFDLVDTHGKGPVAIRELAERNEVPKQFLEHIMLELKRQGWVSSLPGRTGGYELARSPDTITLGQVVRAFHGVLAPIDCVSVVGYRCCGQESRCRFRHVFKEIRDYTAHLMDEATLASVHAGRPLFPKAPKAGRKLRRSV
ncbi:MAG: Rrf2 family transcriptional regulator [Elusimicrobiota bacterium]